MYAAGASEYSDLDVLIAQVVQPVVRSCLQTDLARDYFFIRYGVNGLHIRLRLFGEKHSLPTIRALVEKTTASVDVAIGPLRLEWEPYEPEVDRYGGPVGLAVAERHFRSSSDMAAHLVIQRQLGDRAARLGCALMAMLAVLHAFQITGEAVVTAMRAYSIGYTTLSTGEGAQQVVSQLQNAFGVSLVRQRGRIIPLVTQAWDCLEEGEGLPPVFADFAIALRSSREELRDEAIAGRIRQGQGVLSWADCQRRLVSSYLHMTNNRLGITPLEEAFLASAIVSALNDSMGQPS